MKSNSNEVVELGNAELTRQVGVPLCQRKQQFSMLVVSTKGKGDFGAAGRDHKVGGISLSRSPIPSPGPKVFDQMGKFFAGGNGGVLHSA